MAKSHKKKSAKAGRSKLPKKIADEHLPKELRKSGEALIEAARDTLVREMAVAGFAAMAAGAQRRAASPPEPPAPPRPPEPPRPPHVEAVVIGPDESPGAPMPPEQVIGIIGGAMLNAFREMAGKRGG